MGDLSACTDGASTVVNAELGSRWFPKPVFSTTAFEESEEEPEGSAGPSTCMPVALFMRISSSLMGSLAKGFCGKFAEILRKIRGNLQRNEFYCARERVRKVCGNFAEICGKFSAMTPFRTTP